MERLQKRIAEAGIASRRKAEQMILDGRVKVNGKLVTELGTKVSSKDAIEVDGKIIFASVKKYYVINKPRGIVTTVNDPLKRKTIIDILPDDLKKDKIFPVGRLDYDTKGVLLLTNDGDFMNEMVGPKSGVEKEYLARVKGIVDLSTIRNLSNGVVIDNKQTLPARVEVVSIDGTHSSTLISITITQGNYHQVKKMCEAVGHEVKKLTRVRFGCIKIDKLGEGEIRPLTIHEIKILHELAKMNKNLGER